MKNRRYPHYSMVYCALLTAYCVLFTSCFHKDVMNDRADDVSQSFIYTGKGGSYIITQELIFQATSKSSGGGMTSISGYNECRFTSYDLATGAMLGRVELGEEIDHACKIVGVLNDQIWCYSIDPDLGLHARDPKTLEVVKKEAELSVGAIQLSRPEWSRISDYYAYDANEGKLMVTDMQGLHYYYDAKENKFASTENEMPEVEWSPDYLGSTAYFTKEDYISFDGKDDRKKIRWGYDDSTAGISLLKPSFLLDLNEERDRARVQAQIEELTARRNAVQNRVDSLVKLHPVFKEEYPSWSSMTDEEIDLNSDLRDWRSDVRDIDGDIEDLNKEFGDYEDYALSDTRFGSLVYSANSVSDTARAILTCVDCNAKKFTERWHLDLSSFYFDPDKAEGAGVFDEGDPEFRYRWADIYDGKFVMIAQLQMVCVDMTSGKKLWEIPL